LSILGDTYDNNPTPPAPSVALQILLKRLQPQQRLKDTPTKIVGCNSDELCANCGASGPTVCVTDSLVDKHEAKDYQAVRDRWNVCIDRKKI